MKKGFTLVELLTVVALLGIFALITIPAVTNILDKQKERIQKQNVIAIEDSLKTYNNEIEIEDGKTFSVSLAQLKLEGLLEYELKNPKTKKCYSNANVFTIKRVGESYKYTVGELQDGTDEDCEKPVRILCQYDTGDNHEIGDVISYGDLDWYVIGEDEESLTLVLKGNYTTGSYGTSTDFATSNAFSVLNTDFINENQGISDSIDINQLILDQNTNSYVRLLTKDEVTSYGTSIQNESETPYWTMTADSTNVWYALADGTTSYNKQACSSYGRTCYQCDGTSCSGYGVTSGSLATPVATNTTALPSLTQLTTSYTATLRQTGSCATSYRNGYYDTEWHTSSLSGYVAVYSCTPTEQKFDAGIRPVIKVKHCHLN